MSFLVFVFGTLKEGFPNFPTNQGTRFSGDFVTIERYPLYLVGERLSPWLVNAAGEGERVIGQVFEVDRAALDAMDVLERVSHTDGYRRLLVDVESLQDEPRTVLMVHAYFKEPEHFVHAHARFGPLREYTQAHAALYRSRASVTSPATAADTRR